MLGDGKVLSIIKINVTTSETLAPEHEQEKNKVYTLKKAIISLIRICFHRTFSPRWLRFELRTHKPC